MLESAAKIARSSDDAPIREADVIIDALFGTGFQGEPREDAARTIEEINAAGKPVVAVDLPSGVNASTGEVAGACVQATVTVTMHGPKVGTEVAPGRFQAGEVVVADIGLDPVETEHELVTPAILRAVPRRQPGAEQVHGRDGARGRRLARADRRADASRPRRPSARTLATSRSLSPTRRWPSSSSACSRRSSCPAPRTTA